MGFSVWLFRFLPKCVSSALPQAQSLICHLLQTNFVTGLCTHFLSTSSTPYDFESYLCCFPSNRSGKDHLWRLWNTMVFWKLLLYLYFLQLFATLISLLFWKFDLGFYYLVCSLSAFHFHVTPSLFMVWVFLLLCFLNVQTRSFLFSLYTLILRNITQTYCFLV